MKALSISAIVVAFLAGCSPPQPPQPSGAWVPVNHPPSLPSSSSVPLSSAPKGV